MKPSEILEKRLIKLDKEILEIEKSLEMMNKQIGSKLSKLKNLQAERKEFADAYIVSLTVLDIPLDNSSNTAKLNSSAN